MLNTATLVLLFIIKTFKPGNKNVYSYIQVVLYTQFRIGTMKELILKVKSIHFLMHTWIEFEQINLHYYLYKCKIV